MWNIIGLSKRAEIIWIGSAYLTLSLDSIKYCWTSDQVWRSQSSSSKYCHWYLGIQSSFLILSVPPSLNILYDHCPACLPESFVCRAADPSQTGWSHFHRSHLRPSSSGCQLVFSAHVLLRLQLAQQSWIWRFVSSRDGWSSRCEALQPHAELFTDHCTVKLPVGYLICWLSCASPHGKTALS